MWDFLAQAEQGIVLFFQRTAFPAFLDTLMIVCTRLGDAGLFWVAMAGAFAILPRTRKMGIAALLALALSFLLCNGLLKELLARPRPFSVLPQLVLKIPPEPSFSFPSGHTSASFAVAFVFWRELSPPKGVPFLILAGLIGFSRIYLNMHYLTDVLGGVLLGALCAFLGLFLVRFMAKRTPRRTVQQK